MRKAAKESEEEPKPGFCSCDRWLHRAGAAEKLAATAAAFARFWNWVAREREWRIRSSERCEATSPQTDDGDTRAESLSAWSE